MRLLSGVGGGLVPLGLLWRCGSLWCWLAVHIALALRFPLSALRSPRYPRLLRAARLGVAAWLHGCVAAWLVAAAVRLRVIPSHLSHLFYLFSGP